jgi:hypothetical protein
MTSEPRDRDALVKDEIRTSHHVMHGLSGLETDLVIAEAITNYLIAAALLQHPTIRLAIICNHRICPLPFDWKRKGSVGINAKDREVARDWCMKALLLGYSVFQCWYSTSTSGGGMGTIASYRQSLIERRERAA